MLEQGKTERETDRVLRDTYFVSPERRRLAIETARAGLKAKRDLRPDEISLYVGIPFCPTRCAYCSFVSASVEKSFGLMEPYLASLEQEITDAARMVAETGLRIKSFYMGGGTPTTLSARQMDHLLTHLNRSFDLTDCAEYCIEAGRPDTITREKLQVLLDHGADRISVNPSPWRTRCSGPSAASTRRRTSRRPWRLLPPWGSPCEHGPHRRPARRHAGGLSPHAGQVPDLRRGQHHRPYPQPEKGSRILLEGLPIPSAQDVSAMLDYANEALRAADFTPTTSTARSICPAASRT